MPEVAPVIKTVLPCIFIKNFVVSYHVFQTLYLLSVTFLAMNDLQTLLISLKDRIDLQNQQHQLHGSNYFFHRQCAAELQNYLGPLFFAPYAVDLIERMGKKQYDVVLKFGLRHQQGKPK